MKAFTDLVRECASVMLDELTSPKDGGDELVQELASIFVERIEVEEGHEDELAEAVYCFLSEKLVPFLLRI
jgi:hypothetical protein